MDAFDFLFLTGLAAVAMMIFFSFALPPMVHTLRALSLGFDQMVGQYQFAWSSRRAAADRRAAQRDADREFLNWIRSRVDAVHGDDVDDDLVAAQQLMPIIRVLLESEIPGAVRRCNALHRRMALLSGAVHLREVAGEPECTALRRWTVELLSQTHLLLQQYPIRLRLECDDLLHATIALRKSLLPVCTRCPYIEKTVLAAGEHCPAAELIQIERTQGNA